MVTVWADENLCCWDLQDEQVTSPVVIARAEIKDMSRFFGLAEEMSSSGTQITIAAMRWNG